MQRRAQTGSGELSFYCEAAAEKAGGFRGREIGSAAADGDANAGRRVFGNGDDGWIDGRGEAGQMELELSEFSKRGLRGRTEREQSDRSEKKTANCRRTARAWRQRIPFLFGIGRATAD